MGILCGCILLSACVARPVGYSDFDVDTDFSTFRTFAWVPDGTLVVASPNPVNPQLEGILKEETAAYLTRRGYSYSATQDDADFIIGFSVGGTPTVRTTSFTDNYRQVQIIGTSRSAEVVNQESIDGGIVIDLFDQASGDKKWMGWSITEITRSDQVNLRPAVRELVGVILQHFPPDL
jgi:hypothetical protein